MGKISRNAPCPCGSGKKYKHCHLGTPDDPTSGKGRGRRLAPLLVVLVGLVTGGYLILEKGIGMGLAVGAASILVAGLVAILGNPPPPAGGSRDPGAINFGG